MKQLVILATVLVLGACAHEPVSPCSTTDPALSPRQAADKQRACETKERTLTRNPRI